MSGALRNPRVGYAIGAVVCIALLGYAYYLQYVKGLEPCPLCMVQRFFFYAVMALFILATLHGPRGRGASIYAALITLFAAGGAAAAGRQVWLQHLPPDKVPQCGPDLFFMLENFPLSRTWEKLFYGTGECAQVDWTFLGLSIAGWSLVWFIALAIFAWVAARRRRPA
ncbi:MAG TPA: disulfide bond formation protein B [Burkholderiales bacterium]|nr:disulfide bond formation protein B [Burkholderiales bacterium]